MAELSEFAPRHSRSLGPDETVERMSKEPGGTPEEHLQAALDHLAKAARTWVTDVRDALEPVIGRLSNLGTDPISQARMRQRAEEDVALACNCQCAKVHPGAWVCDLKAVTTIRRSGPSGPTDVPVCAPCAAEVMSQPL
jgi:hypothetical protein